MLAAVFLNPLLMKLRFFYFALLLLSPLIVYEAAIFADYGLRDDYSITRETHEEPGKVLAFTASHGRPLYGIFLEAGYRQIPLIADLTWLRLLSAVFITLFGLFLYRQLQRNGWEPFESAATALIVTFLPASQVTISWAVGWPWGISLMLAILGFRMSEAGWRRSGFSRIWRVTGAIIAYMLATPIYQSNTLFAVALLASVLLSPQFNANNKTKIIQRSVFHLVILFIALVLSYGLLQWFFYHGIFHESGRLQFETNIISKLIWFLSLSLPNALAFLTLRDDFATGVLLFWCVFCVVMWFILFAFYKQIHKKCFLHWFLCLLILPWIAHGISLLAAERALGYRTTFALSGLAVVILIASIREVLPSSLRYMVISLIVIISAIQASWQSYQLIAVPQSREWGMIKNVVANMQPGVSTMIYLIEPKPVDRSTDRVYRDEFGSFTSNSEWAPDEMFKAAVHERFPQGIPQPWHYEFYHGGEPPPVTDHYDQIIDMRTLRQWRK